MHINMAAMRQENIRDLSMHSSVDSIGQFLSSWRTCNDAFQSEGDKVVDDDDDYVDDGDFNEIRLGEPTPLALWST